MGEWKLQLSKENYRRALKKGNIVPLSAVNALLCIIKQHMEIEPLPKELSISKKWGNKITDTLTKLEIYIARGDRSWEGLVVGFPGTKEQLSTESVGTPYIREILYPMLDLHRRIQKSEGRRMPCLYLLGERFRDVFLRKFNLLDAVTPHVVVLTNDLLKNLQSSSKKVSPKHSKITEAWIQDFLCRRMMASKGLKIPVNKGSITTGFISYEVPTFEGTQNPERLDILGYDKKDNSLIAFEIKGPDCGRVQLENLFLQGMEHRNWLEENKMAVKFMFEGPKGKAINTKKRVRLMLGFCGNSVPSLFFELKKQAMRKDPYLKIDFCRLIAPENVNCELKIIRFFDVQRL